MSKWEPIETAPKDKAVLVCGGTYTWDCDYPDTFPLEGVRLVHWSERGQNWEGGWQGDSTGYQDEYYWYKPTHWMSLPEPHA